MSGLRTFTPAELAAIVAAHGKWRRGDDGGQRADLSRADLARANLARADLADANLADANLARANLAGAYLARADLADAYLADAYLARAYLAGAYLAGANRSESDPPTPYVHPTTPEEIAAFEADRAKRFRERHPEVPVVEALDARILDALNVEGCRLDMSQWHGCKTTHCRAGWAIHLAGEAGYALEREHGSQRAGAMIYRASTGRVPHFFASNERALEDIRQCAAKQAVTK